MDVLGEGLVEAHAHHAFGGGDGERGVGGDLGRQRFRAGHEFGIGDDFAGETPTRRIPSPSWCLPVKMIFAAFKPADQRGRSQVPPDSGRMPRLTKDERELWRTRAMMRMSQPSAVSAPWPAAPPFTAQITGLLSRMQHGRRGGAQVDDRWRRRRCRSPHARRPRRLARRLEAGAEGAAGAGQDDAAHVAVRGRHRAAPASAGSAWRRRSCSSGRAR